MSADRLLAAGPPPNSNIDAWVDSLIDTMAAEEEQRHSVAYAQPGANVQTAKAQAAAPAPHHHVVPAALPAHHHHPHSQQQQPSPHGLQIPSQQLVPLAEASYSARSGGAQPDYNSPYPEYQPAPLPSYSVASKEGVGAAVSVLKHDDHEANAAWHQATGLSNGRSAPPASSAPPPQPSGAVRAGGPSAVVQSPFAVQLSNVNTTTNGLPPTGLYGETGGVWGHPDAVPFLTTPPIPFLTDYENEVLRWLNMARAAPLLFAAMLDHTRRPYFTSAGSWIAPEWAGTSNYLPCKEGVRALDDAIAHLRAVRPCQPLSCVEEICDVARASARDGGDRGLTKFDSLERLGPLMRPHIVGKVFQVMGLGVATPRERASRIILSDGDATRFDRRIILDPTLRYIGLGHADHRGIYGKGLCIDVAEKFYSKRTPPPPPDPDVAENWMSAAMERMMRAVQQGDKAGTAKAARALLDGINELEKDAQGREDLEAAVARLKKLLQQLALTAKQSMNDGNFERLRAVMDDFKAKGEAALKMAQELPVRPPPRAFDQVDTMLPGSGMIDAAAEVVNALQGMLDLDD